ncbi:MAG TPA: PDZ domain-containing protein [Bacillales bacterium]|nr:PDZ domain-containing protein [Bacillales bacterium]
MDTLTTIGYGWLQLFMQPLLYLFLLYLVLLHHFRVKKERRQFHVRVYGFWRGVKQALLPGLAAGLLCSVVLVAAGVVLTEGALVLFACLYTLGMLTWRLRLLSPSFPLSASVLLIYYGPPLHTGVNFLDRWMLQGQQTSLPSILILLGLLIVTEAVLIRASAANTVPRLLPGKRGKSVGAHEARKFWLLPLVVLLPGDAWPSFSYWPLFGADDGSFTVTVVPFGLAFYALITYQAPERAVRTVAKRQLTLGVIVLAAAVAALYYADHAWIPPVTAVFALLWQVVWIIVDAQRRNHRSHYFAPHSDSLVVVGVLPESPAEKLGIHVGERIQKVNGVPVSSEERFYEALQQNAAYCKMEVLNESGEVRFVQGAVYQGTHHELGLLFVDGMREASNAASR